ncbi:peptidoglycan-binding protein [Mesorhizobium sp. M6A.T.Cr.TU.017.01.1.1]|nr:peptidoglycan-binding protein [Mesorhizobium sp. M6A.T.Cr.TU.017.01.1.1]
MITRWRMSSITVLTLLASAGLPAIAWSGDDISSLAGQCLGADYSKEASNIKQVRLRFVGSQEITKGYSPVGTGSVVLSYSLWGFPNHEHLWEGYCSKKSDKFLECGQDCQGGSLKITLRGPKVYAYAKGLVYSLKGSISILATQGSLGSFSGMFPLMPVSDAAGGRNCRAAVEHVSVQWRPGDVSSVVEEAEERLSVLGYFLEVPDWTFDDRTSAALRRFQKRYGLEPTGYYDDNTEAMLAAASLVGLSSC